MKYLIFILLSSQVFADLGGGGADLNESEAYDESRKGTTTGGVAGGGDTTTKDKGWQSRPQNGADENMKGGTQGTTTGGELMLIPERHRIRKERTRR